MGCWWVYMHPQRETNAGTGHCSPQRLSDEELKGLGATLVTDEDSLKADMSKP